MPPVPPVPRSMAPTLVFPHIFSNIALLLVFMQFRLPFLIIFASFKRLINPKLSFLLKIHMKQTIFIPLKLLLIDQIEVLFER